MYLFWPLFGCVQFKFTVNVTLLELCMKLFITESGFSARCGILSREVFIDAHFCINTHHSKKRSMPHGFECEGRNEKHGACP